MCVLKLIRVGFLKLLDDEFSCDSQINHVNIFLFLLTKIRMRHEGDFILTKAKKRSFRTVQSPGFYDI